MLRIDNVTKRFGGVQALQDVSFEVEEGDIAGLIGPNGAGKTVLFNCITGVYNTTEGDVYFDSEEITDKPTWQRARRGLARGFQQLRIFPDQTPRENLVMAARPKPIASNVAAVVRGSDDTAAEERADEILERLDILSKADLPAGDLSFGQQKLVQFGVLLMTEPSLIMLDEIMAGVNPELSARMKEYVRTYNDAGTTFLIVEHDVPSIMELCDEVTVLSSGKKLTTGTPNEIRNNEEVIEAYLG